MVAVVAVVAFAIPLALAANRLYRQQALTELSREASRAVGAVSDERTGGRVPPRLPRRLDPQVQIGLYDPAGVLVTGAGPGTSDLAQAAARDDDEHTRVHAGRLEVAVPVRLAGGDGAVLAARSYHEVAVQTRTSWALMGALGLLVCGAAALLARRQASRIARPLEELAVAARALGTGDFSVRPAASGLRETDEAGRALAATAGRLGAMLDRERAFSADASHQIRTPLTALRLGLDSALLTPDADLRAAIRTALERLDRVDATVEDLLALARDTASPSGPLDLAALLADLAERWRPLAGDRPLEVDSEPDLPPARAAATVVNQALDVLVDNAVRHGTGTVRVAARRAGTGVAVEVSDEGAGFSEGSLATAFVRRAPGAAGHGIGLALARGLVEADGGRLVIERAGPPVVAVLLPVADP